MQLSLMDRLANLGRENGKFEIKKSTDNAGYFEIHAGSEFYIILFFTEENLLEAFLQLSVALKVKEKMSK